MADRSLDPTHGFRKFFNDPKTSVMGYIAENIPVDRLGGSAVGQGQGQGQGGRPPASPRLGYAEVNSYLNRYQRQQEYGVQGGSGYAT